MAKLERSLIENFILINRFLQKNRMRYCLIGGLAAGYWGEARFTRDMDFVVVNHSGDLKKLMNIFSGAKFKIVTKGESQFQVVSNAKSKFLADFILAETPYQDWVVQRAIVVKIHDTEVPICSAEDLIILKLIANRRRDIMDIESILRHRAHSLDKKYLKEWMEYWDLKKNFNEEFGKEFPDMFVD